MISRTQLNVEKHNQPNATATHFFFDLVFQATEACNFRAWYQRSGVHTIQTNLGHSVLCAATPAYHQSQNIDIEDQKHTKG